MSTEVEPQTAPSSTELTNYEATQIAVDAYIFALPMVLMEYRRRVYTNVSGGDGRGARGPENEFTHRRTFPDATEKDVIAPNHDTLYSTAWFDVREEPVVISIPDACGKYFFITLLDAWTDAFASLGTRTTGDDARAFVLVGPRWSGIVPDGLELLHAPTSFGCIIGRTRTTVESYVDVNDFQNELCVVPLDKWGRSNSSIFSRVDHAVDMEATPAAQVRALSAADFWKVFGELWVTNPPHANDYPMVHRMERLGVKLRRSIDLANLNAQARNALTSAVPLAQQRIDDATARMGFRANGWRIRDYPVGTWGTGYLRRAAAAMQSVGVSVPEDAMHVVGESDSEGRPFEGTAQYLLHFSKEELPPANAFWSLTMYDAQMSYVWNAIERYALGDRDALRFNEDGSLDLYLQPTSPGGDKESNWLPTPTTGAFIPVLRLYWPRESVLDGKWSPPALKRA